MTGLWLVLILLAACQTILLAACQTQPNQVFIEVDGQRQALTTETTTVREALSEAQIILEPLDRVSPDLYVQLEPGLVIVVTRVTEEKETSREVVPFERQTIVNEALNPGETRLAQLGVNGEEEITVRIVYEDGQEITRQEVSRVVVIEPAPEILVIGPQGELPALPLEGTLAYLSNGNAWLVRDNSGNRRALTTEGNLDGRVFSLSPDGRQLIYTTKLTDEVELPLNEMWLASTTIVGEAPVQLNIKGVLHAEWSPAPNASTLAFSTAERTVNPPGWQANNDLWLLTIPTDSDKPLAPPQQFIPANTQGVYAWWGATFSWSPDGTKLAYSRADQIGLIDLPLTPTSAISTNFTALTNFTPLQTFSEWVWVPKISWSPDGNFIAAPIHGPPLAAEPAEESQRFDLWLLGVDGQIKAKIAEQVGMWANPVWGQAGIAFGQALDPLQSVNSRYSIQLIDRDGSNKRRLFPFQEGLGVQLPDMVWSPRGDLLLFVHDGDLYLVSSVSSPPRQITIDSQVSQPQWIAKEINMITTTTTAPITAGNTLTNPGTAVINPVASITGTGATLTRTGALPDFRATATVTITQQVEVPTTPEVQPSATPVVDIEDLFRGE